MSEITQCRMCHGPNVERFLDLGNHTLMNSLVAEADLHKPEEAFPLHVGFCQDCALVQLMYIVDSKKIYQDVDYLFYSSDMPTLKEYFKELVDEFEEKYVGEGDLVVEIAANDGVLISQFKEGIKTLGVDPATNVVLRALHRGASVINSFFNARLAGQIKNEWGKAKAIIGCNCIAHIDDLERDNPTVAEEGVSAGRQLSRQLSVHEEQANLTILDLEPLNEIRADPHQTP